VFLSVEQRIVYKSLLFLYKCIEVDNENYFKEFISTRNEIHSYVTRGKDKLFIGSQQNRNGQKSLFVNGVKIYNKVRSNIVNVSKRERNLFLSLFVKKEYPIK
jgi:hypothetical protein